MISGVPCAAIARSSTSMALDASRWRPAAGADYEYEWWDIVEIKDGTMKWSALREKGDGTRYTTTFTWKKIQLQ